ncbi:MAG: NAD-glutamate dehydrogenase [Acidimicrobiales bacterium]
MSDSSAQVKGALVDAVVDLAQRRYRGDDPSESSRVMRLYYRRIPAHDLADKEPLELYASAVRHLEMAHTRQPAETLVSVYNPRTEVDGWSSPHTVIDVVCEDMPFIVDSILALLEQLDLQVHLLAHPMAHVQRDEHGDIVRIEDVSNDCPNESLVHLEVDRVSGTTGVRDLQGEVESVLADVRKAVEDWIPMRNQALTLAEELDGWAAEAATGSRRYESSIGNDPAEVAAFLRWMAEGFFTFTGYREYDFVDDAEGVRNVSRPSTGLGLLRQSEPTVRHFGELPPQIAEMARRPTICNLTKANSYSTVHRAVPLDYVGIKEIDEHGHVTGERRFIGLFTSTVYTGRVQDIPIVRARVAGVIERAKFPAGSHDRSRLLNILQTYPRDELFQTDVDSISRMSLEMLDLRDRRQVSLLLRRDDFGRFLVCMVFVPRDRHTTDVRLEIQRILMEAYRGTSCRFSTEISDAPLARLQLVIYTDPRNTHPLPDPEALQQRLSRVIRNWDDDLRAAIVEEHGEDAGLALYVRYRRVFGDSYRNSVLAEAAVFDIERLDALGPDDLDAWLSRPLEARNGEMRCKVYRSSEAITLSEFIPILHDLGAIVTDERPYELNIPAAGPAFIYDIGLRFPNPIDAEDRARFRSALLAVHNHASESDVLNRLVTTADVEWRWVSVLRAYTRYLTQLGGRFSPSYVHEIVIQYADIARGLIDLFRARLDPEHADPSVAQAVRTSLFEAIDVVPSLDADRILRALVSLVEATVRTNAWQIGDDPSRAIALKFDPSQILGMPKPVPAAEIFVYSPRSEGVHLRAGLVARGGLRWSDRMEDYRTEVLGLMKAQSVKNSVIVPVGAKGGFVCRHLPDGDRAAVQEEVVACYQMFVSALLDVTDNLDGDEVVPPPDTVRLDGDDPYLVVAADKGTATFSDIANAIAVDRGFWLHDAFASGGSAGYDHKALAITARGAWCSVEAHFRQLGHDPDTEDFTVVGIGDMSGDVFGNGMLRSPHIRLVAAFDHRHVFIDPTPDAATSFVERQRLFELPQSSWDSYDRTLISEGGGVFPRTLKSISLTPQMVSALGLPLGVSALSPNELIHAILCAPVDLLWNGGIGTYVKASSQTDLDVGDRANDAVRADANELRCRVVGEGGNLGFTQQARIEYARAGGRINTDAIDNSGGVDCSDHEVNIKILLSKAMSDGDLTRKQRDLLLESMADDVCRLVLDNNIVQNETLNAAEVQAGGMVDVHLRLLDWLSERAGLDRELEALPTDAELLHRHIDNDGLTRPELAVLLAYTKNLLTADLSSSDLPDDPWLEERLFAYFPPSLQRDFEGLIHSHPLRRELLSTLVANDIVNHGGISMTHRLIGETSASTSDVARAHLAAWRIYDLADLQAQVRGLADQVSAATQIAIDQEVKRLGERAARWLLRNESQPLAIGRVIEAYREPVEVLHSIVSVDVDASALIEAGVPGPLASQVATLGAAYGFLDLSHVASRTGSSLEQVAAIYGALDAELDLSWLRERITALPRSDHWEALARSALRDDFFREHAELTATVVSRAQRSDDGAPSDLVEAWIARNAVAVDRCRRTFEGIRHDAERDLARVSVAVQAMSQLSRTV